jgi:hypothetical protein
VKYDIDSWTSQSLLNRYVRRDCRASWGVAVEQSDVILLAVVGADGEVSGVTSAVGGAIGLLAAEACEVVHGVESPGRGGRVGIGSWKHDASYITTPISA